MKTTTSNYSLKSAQLLRLLVFTLLLAPLFHPAMAQMPEAGVSYRLKTMFRGDGECQNVSGQLWKLVPIVSADAAPKTVVKVLSATWGVPGRTADVSKRVQELFDAGETKFEVRNHILFADPAKGVQKSLTVTYSKNGVEMSKTVVERGYFEF